MKPIDDRLLNWSQWATARGGKGHACMTGAICESMRRASLGNVWSGHAEQRPTTDDVDALTIERAMRHISQAQRLILWLHYIGRQGIHYVARKCAFRPIEYNERLFAAKEAVEVAAAQIKPV